MSVVPALKKQTVDLDQDLDASYTLPIKSDMIINNILEFIIQ